VCVWGGGGGQLPPPPLALPNRIPAKFFVVIGQRRLCVGAPIPP
jgi:hypothetical protein